MASAPHDQRPGLGTLSIRLLDWRAELPFLLALSLGLLAVYVATMPHTVTFEDAGELISTAHLLGIAHPPGYPTYTMLGKLFTLLPFGSVATRLHLMSAAFAVGACCCVYALVIRTTGSRIAALVASALYGLSSTLWWQAITAEVYALNAFFFFALLLLSTRIADRPSRRLWAGFGLLFGLSLTNHWPLMIIAAPSFAIVLWPVRRSLMEHALVASACTIVALLPYAYLLVASSMHPVIAVYGPLDNIEGLIAYVGRSQYAAHDTSATAGLSDVGGFLLAFGDHVIGEFSVPVWAVVAGGFVASWIVLPRRLAWAGLWAFVASSVVLQAFLRTDFDPLREEIFGAYQLVPYGVAAVWAGSLAAYFVYGEWQTGKVRRLVVSAVATACVVSAGLTNWQRNDMAEDVAALEHASAVLETLPPNAVLFAGVDTDLGQLTYAHLVEGLRPDVTMYSEYGLMFDNALWDPSRDLFATAVQGANELLAERGRFFATERGPLLEQLAATVTLHDRGVYYEVTPRGMPAVTSVAALEPFARRYLDAHRPGASAERWHYYRQEVAGKFCAVLILSGEQHPSLVNNRYCRLREASAALDAGRFREAAMRYEAVLDMPPPVRKKQHHLLYNSYFYSVAKTLDASPGGRAAHRVEFQALAERVLPALDIYPACDNQVLSNLLLLRTVVDVELDWGRIAARFQHCPSHTKALAASTLPSS